MKGSNTRPAFRGALLLRFCTPTRQLSVTSVRLAAKAAAKEEPAAPAAPKQKVLFDELGTVILKQESNDKRRRRQKLAIEPVDRSLSKYVPAGLYYVVIESKRTSNMTKAGKKASMSSLVVVGNGNGALGYAFGRAAEVADSVNKGILRAARSMIPIRRLDNHTIYEKAMAKTKCTRVFARPKTPGNGLVCHKFIAAMCKLAGIKDLGADVLGRTNPLSIVSAFFKLLEEQRTVEERALEEKKSVLEYRHLDAPPRIVLQYQPTSEEKAKQEATRDTVKWLRAFPREPKFSNFLIARKMLAGATVDDATDISKWIASMPRQVNLEHTALAGCPLPTHATAV